MFFGGKRVSRARAVRQSFSGNFFTVIPWKFTFSSVFLRVCTMLLSLWVKSAKDLFNVVLISCMELFNVRAIVHIASNTKGT